METLSILELVLLLLGVPGATVAANQGANRLRQRNGSALVEREEFVRFKEHVYGDLAGLREDIAAMKITLAVLEEKERNHR